MARGATKRNKQTRARATAASAPKRKPSRGARRQSRHVYEQSMFFPMLRRQAKWVFVFLAAAFAVGFVVFGVGTGSGFGGLSDLWNNNSGTSGGPSTSSLEKKVAGNPKDAAAWHQLANNYEVGGETNKAITALARYTALKPKSVGGLQELATQYQNKARSLSTQVTSVQAQVSAVTPNPAFQPSATSPGTKKHPGQDIFPAPTIDSTLSTAYNGRLQKLQTDQKTAFTEAETTYHKIAALQPKNSEVQLSLASVAQQANDLPTTIVALKQYLKLAPASPQAKLVRRELKQLRAFQSTSPTTVTPVPSSTKVTGGGTKSKSKHSKR